jgi:hypothetical protein
MHGQLPRLSPRKGRTACRAPARRRLAGEALEDRVTPSALAPCAATSERDHVVDAACRLLSNATDAPRLPEAALGITPDVVPSSPDVIQTISAAGPNPLLNLPTCFRARPGATVTVPVNLDISDGLQKADIVLSYDTRRLVVRCGADVRRGSLTGDFNVFGVNLDAQAGTIRVGLGRTAGAISGRGSGSVIEITFRVRPNAPPGRAIVNLRKDLGQTQTHLNGGSLDLNPGPSNDAGDALDGAIRVMGLGPREPLKFRPPRAAPGGDNAVLTNFLLWLQECPELEPTDGDEPSEPTDSDEFFRWLTEVSAEVDGDSPANEGLSLEDSWDQFWGWLDEQDFWESLDGTSCAS